MKKENFVNKKNAIKIILATLLLAVACLGMLFFAKFLTNISVGADNPEVLLNGELEKYINFKISNEDKGTLVQYGIESSVEQKGEQVNPIREKELTISLNQIDGKYPYLVKAIAKSTEMTNGKKENIEENFQYDANNGIVTINTSNINESEELINSLKPSENAKDKYSIICYYDSYIEEAAERELNIKVALNASLFDEETGITKETEFKVVVSEDVGELTSIAYDSSDVVNGYIKSNIINGTTYITTYTETQNITVSKKEAQEKIKIIENNTFIKENQNANEEELIKDLGNNGNLVYKNTKIRKEDITNLLGEDGIVEISDVSGNILGTINKDTQFQEDGTLVINYENEPQAIIIKTSEIINEGTLRLENSKEIKSTMLEADVKIKTTSKLLGINENVEIVNNEEVKTDIETFTNNYESIIDIKDAQTNVKMELNTSEWTNKQQNEVNFDIYVNANTINDNMLKNPTIKIELPNEVEKVILGQSSAIYTNGLELQDPYLETNENGNIVIAANLIGTQTRYDENTLGLVTNVKISATIILKKDIENTIGNVNLTFTNQYTLDGKNEIQTKTNKVQIKSYKEETSNKGKLTMFSSIGETSNTTVENLEGLKVEVVPVKGDTILKDGDIVYEGEFIKYNIKVTNTSDKQIDNIRVVGSIPEGTVYGELEADYTKETGEYYYNFNENLREKEIKINTLKSGETITEFYEVQVADLVDEQIEKQIITNIKGYVGETQAIDYSITNIIKNAELKVFLGAFLGSEKNAWDYTLLVSSDEVDEVTATLKLPKEFKLDYVLIEPGYEGGGSKLDLNSIVNIEENEISITIQTNKRYLIAGCINRVATEEETENSELELTAVASIEIGDEIYSSNQNRIIYGYDSVSIVMASKNEGEEVKYGEQISYEIVVENTGKSNLQNQFISYIEVNVIDFLPKDVELKKITYNNYKEEKNKEENDENGQTQSYEPTGIFNEEEIVIEDIGILKDEEGNVLPNVDLNLTIPYGKSVSIKVETTAGLVFEKTKIENSATVLGILEEDNIKSKTSNTIIHTILPYDYEENEDLDDSDTPNSPSNPNNPTQNAEKYSISGMAWIDEDEDGKRQANEQVVSEIPVMLINSNNSSQISKKTTTDSNGKYYFSELEKGNYIVIFNYDSNAYSVTEYRKSGISNSTNSDVITKEINLMGNKIKVGITDTINLNASVSNIDIGLIKNKICDIKLDKYISEIQVITASGTKEYTYEKEKLAKIEIKAKELQGATVVVNYKLVVTNEGELPVSAVKVVDYIPEGFTFSSELNKNWIKNTSDEVVNITNESIKPEESMELTLILTKTMTTNSTGNFINMAEIQEVRNFLGVKDIDSTPGNKIETEDDFSKVELIISISTGTFMYISFGMLLIALIGSVIFLSYKYGILKIGKISLFGIIIVAIMISGGNNVEADNIYNIEKEAPETAEFAWTPDSHGYSNNYGSRYFYGKKTTGNALCIQAGVNVASVDPNYSEYKFVKYTGSSDYEKAEEQTSNLKFDLTKLNGEDEVIEVSDQHSSGQAMKLLKTFKFKCSSTDAELEISVYNYNKEKVYYEPAQKITNKGMELQENGKYKIYKEYKDKEIEFYIYVKAEDYEKGIAYIELTAQTNAVVTTETKVYKQAKYSCTTDTSSQDVITFNRFLDDSKSEEKSKIVSNTKSIKWMNLTGNLKIIKIDKETGEPLKGVKFRIIGPNLKNTYTTDDNGEISLENMSVGEYKIKEILNPNYGYTDMIEDTVKVKSAQTLTYEAKNEKQTGNLQIVKKDYHSNKALKGVSFRIKSIEKAGYIKAISGNNNYKTVTGKVKLTNMEITANSEEATIFTTNEEGKIEIINMITGDYVLEEIDVGDNYGYEIDDEYITWNNGKTEGIGASIPITINRQSFEETNESLNSTSIKYSNKVNVYNRQKYIKLSGYAWEDIAKTKQTERNYLYDQNAEDKRLQNIAVTLVDEDGNAIGGTTTDKNGEYTFEKVEIESIDGGGYVKFLYNGFSYQTVDVNCIDAEGIKVENGNTAKEYEEQKNGKIVDSREEFNKKYATITKDGVYKEDGKILSQNLSYDSDDYTSTLNLTKSNPKYGYEGQKYPIMTSDHEDIYFIRARTETNTDNENEYRLFGQNKTIEQILKEGKDEITNINLGLYEREQPDIALLKDLYNVKISVNGYNHIYEYGQRLNHLASYKKDEEAVFNAGVEFPSRKQDDYNNISYIRAIYTADYNYENTQEKSKELKVYATYKIVIKNESDNLKVRVNEIVDNYHKAFTFETIGTKIDDNTGEISGKVDYSNDNSNKTISIKTDTKISGTNQGNNTTEIYIQFSITKDKLGEFLHEATEDNQTYKTTNNLENMAEITSYSVFDESGENIYAGIDKDSKPGNADLAKAREGKREDDTSLAPGFVIEVKNSRKITGTVFLDESDFGENEDQNATHTNDTRNGNGIYDESESKISGVKVGLYKTSDLKQDTDGNYKLKDGVTPTGKTRYNKGGETTINDGEFTIQDFYPGEYVIVYTWGNKAYIDGNPNNPINVNDYKGTIYVDKNRAQKSDWYLSNADDRYSDAMDNYATRSEIDKEDSTITTMDSTTPTMEFGVEMGDDLTNKIGNTSGIDKIEFIIPNVDFGITERARQLLDVEKTVNSVEISVGTSTIAYGELEEKNGKLQLTEKSSKYLTYIPPSGEQGNGMIKAEIDSELLHGAKIKIKYNISVINNSEIDYDVEKYYLYGDITGLTENNMIKYKPKRIYDYLDNSLSYSENLWKIQTLNEENGYNDTVGLKTVTEEYLYKNYSILNDYSDAYTGYEDFEIQYKDAIEDWIQDKVNKAREKRLNGKTILQYNENIDIVNPGNKKDVATINVEGELANTQEIDLNNDVEITNVERQGNTGRKITTSALYDRAESVVITSPTGDNQNYILIVGMVISFLVTIGTGIIFIKKKILR